MLLLHYLGKQIKCIMTNFSPINQSYTLQLYSLKQHPVIYTTSQSSITIASIQNVLFHSHRPESLLPLVNSIVHNALQQAMPCADQALFDISHISNWRLIHIILHHASYSTANRTKIRTT